MATTSSLSQLNSDMSKGRLANAMVANQPTKFDQQGCNIGNIMFQTRNLMNRHVQNSQIVADHI